MTARKFEVPKCNFGMDPANNCIVTDGTVHQKITGTSFGAIMGVNPWMSPFEASCRLLGLIDEDIGDKPAVHTGTVCEVPIIRHLDNVYSNQYGRFLPDEELNICAPRVGPHESWKSDWDDPVFGGHIDGAVINGDDVSILEIKTARDLSAWENDVPLHYQYQVRLYNWFLTQKDTAFVGLGVVDEDAYKDPESWVPSPNNVMLFNIDTDMEQTAKDIDYARTWYESYVLQNRTTAYNPNNPRDVEIWDFLSSVVTPQDEMMENIDTLAQLEAEIAEYDAVIEDKRKDAEALKKTIKDHMVTNAVDKMESATHDYIVTIRHQERKSFDEKKMKDAGIDPDDFKMVTVTNVFNIKTRK